MADQRGNVGSTIRNDLSGTLVQQTIKEPGMSGSALYDLDDELLGLSANANTTVTLAGSVSPGPNNNKWYNTWAECRGVRLKVNALNATYDCSSDYITLGT